MAAVNKTNYFSNEKMEQAFSLFDPDENGEVSLDSIKRLLSGNEEVSQEAWIGMLKQLGFENKKKVLSPCHSVHCFKCDLDQLP